MRSSHNISWSLSASKLASLNPQTAKRSALAVALGYSHLSKVVDLIVPRYRFGTSVYTTPMLLLLRLFYGASSFGKTDSNQQPEFSYAVPMSVASPDASAVFRTPRKEGSAEHIHICSVKKINVTNWYSEVQVDQSLPSWRLVSITWVKALASNMAHEYVQFVIAGPRPEMRYRLVVDRNEDGDYIFSGHDWTSATEPASSHVLPLPLLSLSYNHLEYSAQPLLSDFAGIIASVSASQPGYDALRYMCWWFAETIFSTTLARHGGHLVEWESAKLRYSFVVRTNVITRRKLTKRAENFRMLNTHSMVY